MRIAALLLTALLAALPALAPGTASAADPTSPSSAEVEALRLAADGKVEQRDYDGAIRLYKRATKAAAYRCALCQIGLAKAYTALGRPVDAAESAEAALRMSDDPAVQAVAWNQLALAQFVAAGKDAAKLRLAEASFRKALTLTPGPMTRFNLGVTLLRLGRDEEGLSELRAFVESAPQTAQAKTARDILENPRRARESMLPSLDLVTLDGMHITNQDLAGKVVLIDFWGTWCAPCRDSIPSLKALVERSKELPMVVISVSNDSDEAALKGFIAQHSMAWPQVWDRNERFGSELKVDRYPTYLLADHEGLIVFRFSGWGEDVERAIQSELRRALAKAKRAGDPSPP